MTLFATTIVMSAGVAVTQPAMAALVGRWVPRHIGLGTGIYTNGLLVGEILPIALSPLLFPLLGGSLARDIRVVGDTDCRDRPAGDGAGAA